MPKLVHSLQFTVYSNRYSVNREPITVNRKSFGFTLIELLVVIAIIAILIGAGTVSYTIAQKKGRDARRKTDLKALQQALDQYFSQNGKYPDAGTGSDDGKIKCNAGSPMDTTPLTWGTSAFTCNSVTYTNQVPKDPTDQSLTNGYYYSSSGSPPNTYKISADLENNSDPDRVTGPTPCTPQGTRDYCVVNP